MKKKNMSESATPIKNFLNVEKQDIANEMFLNVNILTVDASMGNIWGY